MALSSAEMGESTEGRAGGRAIRSSVWGTSVFEMPGRHPSRDIKVGKIFVKIEPLLLSLNQKKKHLLANDTHTGSIH